VIRQIETGDFCPCANPKHKRITMQGAELLERSNAHRYLPPLPVDYALWRANGVFLDMAKNIIDIL
jgi:hypothetical protein